MTENTLLKRTLPIALAVVILAVLSLTPAARAQVQVATVAVDGMACPFCAFGIEKRLKKVSGTGSVSVSAKSGSAEILAKDGQSIDVGQIPRAIKSAGFTAGTITITVEGILNTDGKGRVLLDGGDNEQRFLLEGLDAGMEERLHALAEHGARIRAQGALRDLETDVPILTVATIDEMVT